jgi:hypothetical protein
MSVLSDKKATVGDFQNLRSYTHQTSFINNGGIGDWGDANPGDVITWNPGSQVWEPQPPVSGSNVFVSPDSSNAPFYLTFVNTDSGSTPLKTNTNISYNPSTETLTVTALNGIAAYAIHAETADTATTANTATIATKVAVTNDPGTNATYYPTFVTTNSGNNNIRTDSSILTYNPGTNTLTVPNLQGNASSATSATNATNANNVVVTNDPSTNATFYPTFVANSSGNQALKVDTNTLTFNPFTNTLTVANVNGTASNATNSVNSQNVAVTDNTAGSGTFFPTFVTSNSGNTPINVDSLSLTYNPSTNTLSVSNLFGNASSATNASNVSVQDDTTTNSNLYPTFVAANTGNQNIRVDSTALTYNPFTNILSCTSLNVTNINGSPYPPTLPSRFPTGNTLTVDIVNGNDGLAAANRYAYPFKSISGALALAVSGENVIVNAGVYNETLTIPNGVSLTGTGTQCVVIQKLNVDVPTTLITVGTGCRLENFTANLSSSLNVALTGIHFPAGASTTSKMRNSVWTITCTSGSNPTIIGALSDGNAAPVTYTAVNAIQRTTINVISSSSGITRGIYVTNANYFSVRDMVVWARGTGTNIVGVETTTALAYCEIKTSTISGVLYDINRTAGNILLGFTDLRNNRANGNSFSVVTESSTTTFGFFGNPSASVYYLVPGTAKTTELPTSAFEVPVVQNTILFVGTIRFTGSIGTSLTFNIYKNGGGSAVYSIVLLNGETSKSEETKSVDFTQGDTYHATVNLVGAITSGTFTATLGFY